MAVTTEGDSSKELTLAFELAAIRQLAHPENVFTDARQWSRYVGVIANDSEAVRTFLQTNEIHHDFELGSRDKWLALQEIHDTTDTGRYVFVGVNQDDRLAAEQTGWEFVPISKAAEKAEWTQRGNSESTDGILTRLRTFLSDG